MTADSDHLLAALVVQVREVKDLLRDVLRELARQLLANTKSVDRRWLTIAEAAEYCGMSEKWIRTLEAVAPAGTFTKIKGTIFVNRVRLDRYFESGVREQEAPDADLHRRPQSRTA